MTNDIAENRLMNFIQTPDKETETETGESARKSTQLRFRPALGGYNKKEVAEYLKTQQSASDTTIASYEEKLEQMRNSNIMLSHEIENIRRENAEARAARDKMTERMKLVENEAEKYDALLRENSELKARIAGSEESEAKAGELEVTTAHLTARLKEAEDALETAGKRSAELENGIFELRGQLVESERRTRIATAQLNAERKLSDEKRRLAVERLRAELASIMSGLDTLDRDGGASQK